MSDNFGSRQDRVLNVEDRSLDNVVFQHRTPPLSSEWNLINQISNEKIQKSIKAQIPSGWMTVRDVVSVEEDAISESSALTGQILTSSSFEANALKVISKNQDNIAIVNGWPLVYQGTNVPFAQDDNKIELLAPSGDSFKFDFVFLEVWKKLIGAEDPVYPYGNTDAVPYPNNEVVWSSLGIETSKRVQLQYRTRTARFNSVIAGTEGFDNTVYPIGGRTSEYSFQAYKFRAAGASDPGLYVSGSGTSFDQEILGTVDGYVYAIPMFFVYRRKNGTFSNSSIHASKVTRSNYVAGARSDRPDAKIQDIIYKNDIMDLRHTVGTSKDDLNNVVEKSFRKLVTGTLNTSINKGFTDFIGSRKTYPGGASYLKIERLNGIVGDNIPNLGVGLSDPDGLKKRVYSNASVLSDNCIIKISLSKVDATDSEDPTGTQWAVGAYGLEDLIDDSIGSVTEIFGFFSYGNDVKGTVTGVDYEPSTNIMNVSSGSNLIDPVATAQDIYMQFSFTYNRGNNGFKDVPVKMLEYNKNYKVPFATRDQSLLLRTNQNLEYLDFNAQGKDKNDLVTDEKDFISFDGSSYTETYEFGHILTIHRKLEGSNQITIPTPNGKLNGYYILGVRAIYEESSTVEGQYSLKSFDIERSHNTPDFYISEYTIIAQGISDLTSNVKIELYTGSKPNDENNNYHLSDSIKFFDFSKQGRGIINITEMMDIVAEYDPAEDGYVVDTGNAKIKNKFILKLAAKKVVDTPLYHKGSVYAFTENGDGVTDLEITVDGSAQQEVNRFLPIMNSSRYSSEFLPTRIVLKSVSATVANSDYLRVPVLVQSYVEAPEVPYNIYYNFSAYQGLLLPTTQYQGIFESENSALVTTEGSGSINNWIYNVGKAKFSNSNKRQVIPVEFGGADPDWANHIKDGFTYYIRVATSRRYYRVKEYDQASSSLILTEPFMEAAVTAAYEIIRLDVPENNIANIIDRMPSFFFQDYKGQADDMSLSDSTGATFNVRTVTRMQDPLDAFLGDFILGSDVNSSSGVLTRGRANINLTEGRNDVFRLENPRPHVKYPTLMSNIEGEKRLYQAYLFNLKDNEGNTGRLYLAVIASGSNNDTTETMLNSYTTRDTVDIFELVGRPLIRS